MSTDRKRLNKAIQRIAREDPEIRKLLDDFRNSGGKPSESATSGSGAEDRQICCDGGTSGSTNPGSDTRDPGDNAKDGLDPDDPANISDNLTGVTDCATGQPICFAGSDWIPPEGWDGPTAPPIDPEYEDGFYWGQGSGGSSLSALSPSALCSKISASRQDSGCGADRYSTTGANCKEINPDTGDCLGFATIFRYACDGAAICEEDPPRAQYWPEDGCVNLAVKGGKLVGSKYDPENDGSWSAPRDEVELCDAFGNKFKLSGSGSIEGGWKSISSQNPDDGYLYNAQGQQIARISESEYSDPTM